MNKILLFAAYQIASILALCLAPCRAAEERGRAQREEPEAAEIPAPSAGPQISASAGAEASNPSLSPAREGSGLEMPQTPRDPKTLSEIMEERLNIQDPDAPLAPAARESDDGEPSNGEEESISDAEMCFNDGLESLNDKEERPAPKEGEPAETNSSESPEIKKARDFGSSNLQPSQDKEGGSPVEHTDSHPLRRQKKHIDIPSLAKEKELTKTPGRSSACKEEKRRGPWK